MLFKISIKFYFYWMFSTQINPYLFELKKNKIINKQCYLLKMFLNYILTKIIGFKLKIFYFFFIRSYKYLFSK